MTSTEVVNTRTVVCVALLNNYIRRGSSLQETLKKKPELGPVPNSDTSETMQVALLFKLILPLQFFSSCSNDQIISGRQLWPSSTLSKTSDVILGGNRFLGNFRLSLNNHVPFIFQYFCKNRNKTIFVSCFRKVLPSKKTSSET